MCDLQHLNADAGSSLLVACNGTLHPAMSIRRSVGWLVARLVGQSPFYFFGVFKLFEGTAPAQMP